MKDEKIIRKQAVELHLKSIPINDIADALGKTRHWVVSLRLDAYCSDDFA